jgi:integrase
MEWSHVGLPSGIWTQPGRLTKNRDPHRIQLHSLATEILRARHAAAGRPKEGLIFPAPVSGRPLDTFSDLKEALDAASGLTGCRWHDFRRSFATALGEAGVPEPVADAVLNHRQSATRGSVLGVYQRARRWPEQKRAMQVWGEVVASVLGDG